LHRIRHFETDEILCIGLQHVGGECFEYLLPVGTRRMAHDCNAQGFAANRVGGQPRFLWRHTSR
jgi:hypothetical protein